MKKPRRKVPARKVAKPKHVAPKHVVPKVQAKHGHHPHQHQPGRPVVRKKGIVPHHPVRHVRAKKGKPKPRKWSPGWDVACCSAEAVGLLLGLSDADVLELYWLTADDPDAGASIKDTLTAAGCPSCRWTYGVTPAAAPLILGIQLEQPHAVAVTPDGTWWSWGEPWQPPPDLIIDETWAVLL
jgi:hypothetical protein